MKLSIGSVINGIDRFTEQFGRALSWLVILLVLLISYDVTMRYAFHQGSVALQELEWHLFAALFLLAGAYTLKHDAHVRVDVIYRSRFVSDRGRAWINLFGILLFLMPFCLVVIYGSWPFIESAYRYQESSPDPGGLPHRFIIKSAILIGFALILLQSVAELLKQIVVLNQQERD